jgi:hypothetical protein
MVMRASVAFSAERQVEDKECEQQDGDSPRALAGRLERTSDEVDHGAGHDEGKGGGQELPEWAGVANTFGGLQSDDHPQRADEQACPAAPGSQGIVVEAGEGIESHTTPDTLGDRHNQHNLMGMRALCPGA